MVVDRRELGSDVLRQVVRRNYPIYIMDLDVGDYILSDRVAVERKTHRDFVASIKDGRIFDQMSRLKATYENPVLILQGYGIPPSIKPQSFYGAIASIMTDFGVNVLLLKDSSSVAEVLISISRREFDTGRIPKVRHYKPTMTREERMRYIVEGLPNVSAVLAIRLLEHFDSIDAIFNASVEELMEVPGIGKEKATEIYNVIRMRWSERNQT